MQGAEKTVRMSYAALVCLLAPFLALEAPPANAAGPAGIKLDGSLGPSAAALAGPTYNITQNLGKLSGGNLFFSFQYFNVATGETALFTTTSAGINNVISRVTGGYVSTIDGTIELQAASGAPNFFLINPSGVTFTANAVVDVPAAFYVSTANYLKFSDGNFYVDPTRMSALSAAAPEAFGFLGTTRAPVNIEGANLSAGVNGAGDFQIAAGDVTVDGGGGFKDVNGDLQPVGISNTTGNIRLTALGSASGEVPLTGPFAATDGTVTIRNGGMLLTQGQGASIGGVIEINAGNLLIDGLGLPFINSNFNTGIFTLAGVLGPGSNSAGPINISVGGNVQILNDSTISTAAIGPGSAGAISVNAKNLTIDPGAFDYAYISSFTALSGAAGDIVTHVAGSASLINGGEITSSNSGSGNAANISLSANSLTIDGGSGAIPFTGLFTTSDAGASGSAGHIVINVSGSASILNSGQIGAEANGSGNAGQINLSAGSLTINGGPLFYPTGLIGNAFDGSSGSSANITVDVSGAASIVDGAQITVSTYGAGNAGAISLNAASLTINEVGPPNPNSVPVTAILANTYSTGNAGQINLKLGSLTISGGNSTYFVGISSADNNQAFGLNGSGSAGSGASGSISVDITGNATLKNGGQITTATYGPGAAGDVSVTAGSLTIGGGANLSSISSQAYQLSGGQTGQVIINTGLLTIEANGSINISDAATPSDPSAITPTLIKIDANKIDTNGGEVTAKSTGNVAASGIDITYNSSLNMGPGTISTSAVDGNGGIIAITGQGPLFVDHSNITTSVSGINNGNGGDIVINVPEIVLDTGAIQANTTAPLASGGAVRINSQALVPSFQSFLLGGSAVAFVAGATGLNVVQAAAPDGVNGALSVTVPTLDLGNALLGLTGRPSAAVALGRGLCGSSHDSSLAIAGHGGVAPTAYDPLWFDPDESWGEAVAHIDASTTAANSERAAQSDTACR